MAEKSLAAEGVWAVGLSWAGNWLSSGFWARREPREKRSQEPDVLGPFWGQMCCVRPNSDVMGQT